MPRIIRKQKINTIIKLVEKYRQEAKLDRARLEVLLWTENDSSAVDQMKGLLPIARTGDRAFPLRRAIFSDESLLEVSASDIDRILDEKVHLSDDWQEGLRLVCSGKDDVYVDTLRKFRDATAEGYYAQSNAEMKMSVPYFFRPLDVLDSIAQARIPEVSFLTSPTIGLSDFDLLPARLIADSRHMVASGALPVDEDDLDRMTIACLVEKGLISVKEKEEDLVLIQSTEMSTFIFEIMRGDFNRDGHEDILIHCGYAALHGSFSTGGTVLLTRFDHESRLQVAPRLSQHWKDAGHLHWENARLRDEVAKVQMKLDWYKNPWWKRWFGRSKL